MICLIKLKTSFSICFIILVSTFLFHFNATADNTALKTVPLEVKEAGYSKSSKVSEWIGKHQFLIESFGQAISSGSKPQRVKSYLNNTVWDDDYLYSYFGSEDGIITILPDFEYPEGYDPRNRPWYTRTKKAKVTTLSDPYHNAATDGFILTITTPVFNGTNLLGIFGSDINAQALVKLLKTEIKKGVSQFFLINRQGKILLHTSTVQSLHSLKHALSTEHVEIKENHAVTLGDQKGTILTFYKINGIPASDWYICAAFSKKNK
ncbi:cache domain-containing protein [Kiloniella sp. EL199]|uniref:cache domain-containing protein n=1 Tax=Kiloniella sp. EL199 TaxID=2107581 RepID=UPI000EA2E6BE|nr:cache domain-containing protein [Kiloniella sp. EL199]